MAAARQVLERSTMMLLTSSKTCLRYPECDDSRENRDTVFCQMRRAMDLIHYVVKDGVLQATAERNSSRGQTLADWDTEFSTASSSLRLFSRLMEHSRPRFDAPHPSTTVPKQSNKDISTTPNGGGSGSAGNSRGGGAGGGAEGGAAGGSTTRDCETTANDGGRRELARSNSQRDRNLSNHHKSSKYQSLERELPYTTTSKNDVLNAELSILAPHTREELMAALDKVVEKTQDFTDSAYTTHEHRENILLLCDRTRLELNQCLRMAVNMEQFPNSSFDIDAAVDSVLSATQDLSNQLCMAVADQTAELNHVIKLGIDLVNSLRTIAIDQEIDKLQEFSERFHDYIEHILDVSVALV